MKPLASKIAIVFAGALLFSIPNADAVECPDPATVTIGGEARTTLKQIDEVRTRLIGKKPDDGLRTIIQWLKQIYPEATAAEITNLLITAYCPLVAAEKYSTQVASEKIKMFGSDVLRVLGEQGD